MNYATVPLTSEHDRTKFSCGKDLLDTYFQKQAKQDVKRKLSACFVSQDKNSDNISGYYTLSSSSIPNSIIPDNFKNNLLRSYLSIPTILIGRLAIDKKYRQQGLGKILLIDALRRCFDSSKSIGAYAVVVAPFDNETESFYKKYGFIKLLDSGKMFLPMKTIEQLFA